jgi:hypothetical protein
MKEVWEWFLYQPKRFLETGISRALAQESYQEGIS